jgi:hypothetical protein
VHLAPLLREWTKQMEREFRSLALVEAKGALAPDQAGRLEKLSRWRDQLIEPLSLEDVLRQLKRDRLMDKISETLRECVEFHEGARNARPAAS